jgi:hypothetical protein
MPMFKTLMLWMSLLRREIAYQTWASWMRESRIYTNRLGKFFSLPDSYPQGCREWNLLIPLFPQCTLTYPQCTLPHQCHHFSLHNLHSTSNSPTNSTIRSPIKCISHPSPPLSPLPSNSRIPNFLPHSLQMFPRNLRKNLHKNLCNNLRKNLRKNLREIFDRTAKVFIQLMS